MEKPNLCFLIEANDLLEKYNAIWHKVSADIRDNLITILPTIKISKKPK